MRSFNLLQLAVVKQDVFTSCKSDNINKIFLTSKLASLSIGFNNTNFELEQASLKPVRETDFMLCLKFLSPRNFVPQKKKFWEKQI